jgi:RHS repeat-associated protein
VGGGPVDLEYIYSATQNNGRITQRKNWLSGEVVTYTYDSLQRLTQATATGPSPWSESCTFDGFGNLTGKAGSNWVVNASTNRINGLSYDANGNQANGGSSAYDIDNRLLTWDGTEQYRYDASNKRVFRRWTNGTGQLQETYSMYGVNGKVTAELAAVYDPAAGVQPGMVLTPTATYQYVGIRKVGWNEGMEDRLGTKPAGSGRPYGENVSQYATHQKDATGLHYADQRYYASSWGRFLTPDPYKASGGAEEPGSWNRYVYVVGDPVNLHDPSGLFSEPCPAGSVRDEGTGQCVPENCLTCYPTSPPNAPTTTNPDPEVEQRTNSGPPYRTTFAQAKRVFDAALNDIATRGEYSPKCRLALSKLGVTPSMLAGAASKVRIVDASASNTRMRDLYANGTTAQRNAAFGTYGEQTVRQHVASIQGTVALTELNGINSLEGVGRIYLNAAGFHPSGDYGYT